MADSLSFQTHRLDVFFIRLNSFAVNEVAQFLSKNQSKTPLFSNKLLALDCESISDEEIEKTDWQLLVDLFQQSGWAIIGVSGLNEKWRDRVQQNRLFYFENTPKLPANEEKSAENKADNQAVCKPTVIIDTPIRTGQQVYAEGADLIVLNVVSEGAEIIADGNIHVYSILRGRALAGASGDRSARIFVHNMQAQLVSIAGIYRLFEQKLPNSLQAQSISIFLDAQNKLVLKPLDSKF